MTEVHFYFNLANKFDYTAVLTTKLLFSQHNKVFILAEDAMVAKALQINLWQRDDVFLPNVLQNETWGVKFTPIVIGWENISQEHHLWGQDEVLLHHGSDVPKLFERFQKVIEFVGQEEEDKKYGRERYRFYKQRGYPILSQDISLL